MLYLHQPEACRRPLKLLESVVLDSEEVRKVLEFDPTPLYDRINEAKLRDPFRRYQSVSMPFLFPRKDDLTCSCGCGEALTGRQTRWHSKKCQRFALRVFDVIAGASNTIGFLVSRHRGGRFCSTCGHNGWDVELELDHIIPVKHGGGGGWLSNYEFKCKKCHREKTNKDFGFKKII